MSFWKYIGEFLFFRWLFGSRKRSDIVHHEDTSSPYSNNDDDCFDSDLNYKNIYGQYSRYLDNQDYDYSQSYDDYLDEQDDYDLMDDDF